MTGGTREFDRTKSMFRLVRAALREAMFFLRCFVRGTRTIMWREMLLSVVSVFKRKKEVWSCRV